MGCLVDKELWGQSLTSTSTFPCWCHSSSAPHILYICHRCCLVLSTDSVVEYDTSDLIYPNSNMIIDLKTNIILCVCVCVCVCASAAFIGQWERYSCEREYFVVQLKKNIRHNVTWIIKFVYWLLNMQICKFLRHKTTLKIHLYLLMHILLLLYYLKANFTQIWNNHFTLYCNPCIAETIVFLKRKKKVLILK
jgi:hypothetical protein